MTFIPEPLNTFLLSLSCKISFFPSNLLYQQSKTPCCLIAVVKKNNRGKFMSLKRFPTTTGYPDQLMPPRGEKHFTCFILNSARQKIGSVFFRFGKH